MRIYNNNELNIKQKLSSGSFGVCYLTYDKENNFYVTKRNIGSVHLDHCMSIREMDILNKLRSPYVVDLKAISFENPIKNERPMSPIKEQNIKNDNLYFHFEKADCDLFNLIRSGPNYSDIKLIILQLCIGLEFIHSHKIAHRDIKPENLLWFMDKNGSGRVKYCDFGVSWFITDQENISNAKVTTSWYRAPEITLDIAQDPYLTDIWSLGCVFFELLQRKNYKALLTVKGQEDIDILFNIIKNCPDVPDNDYINKLITKESNKYYIKEAYKKRSNLNLKTMLAACGINENEFNDSPYGGTYDQFLDLLKLMLKFNANDRIKSFELLNHPYFTSCKDIMQREKFYRFSEPQDNSNIIIKNTKGFNAALHEAFCAFNKVKELNITKKVIFMSIDIFIRYLDYLRKNINNDYLFISQDEKISQDCYFSCLYLAIKYYGTNFSNYPIHKIMPKCQYKDYNSELFGKFEIFLIKDVLDYKIYRPTIYEYADNFNKSWTSEEVRQLVMYFKELDFNGTLDQFYNSFVKRSSKSPIPYILKDKKFSPIMYPIIESDNDNNNIISTTKNFNNQCRFNYTSKACV